MRARYVVVAADALRTPQLLFASGVRPPALGRYLNDQPQMVFAVRLRDVEHPAGGSTTRAATPRSPSRAACSWVPYTDEHPFHGQVMQLDASPVPLVGDDVPAPGRSSAWAGSAARTCRRPTASSSPTTSADDYGMPSQRIHYRLTERDHRTLADAREAILRAAAARSASRSATRR